MTCMTSHGFNMTLTFSQKNKYLFNKIRYFEHSRLEEYAFPNKNKRWARSCLCKQHVGGIHWAGKEHNLLSVEFVDETYSLIGRQSGSNGDVSGWPHSHAGRTGPEHWSPPTEPGPGNRTPEVNMLNLSSLGTNLTRGMHCWYWQPGTRIHIYNIHEHTES